jgi:5'-nucleotidase (lipoprotein e(P4) family)
MMKKLAVILDLDETVLDNSPYEARLILDNISYPDRWVEWCNLASAAAVPGAVEFIRRAGELGVDVFYITNRREELREVTLKNLVAIGLPNVTEDQLLMRIDGPAKETRRTRVAQTHKMGLLIGDNLNDFSELFEMVSGDQRLQLAHRLKDSFGDTFIVLPNAMYGNWIQELYPETATTPALKRAARYRKLKGFLNCGCLKVHDGLRSGTM